jgi:membrane protein YqaA with SNARE-associated domain
MHLFAAFTVKKALWLWVQRLGGPGLVLLGLVDNSVIPTPGGMDVFTILLAMSHREWWWYYALMATVGSVIGSYLTYRMGEKGGEETLDKKLSKKRAVKFRAIFKKYGFWAIVVGCVTPPPMPIAPFFLLPGAMKYPLKKFFTAVALGRAVRYFLFAYLGSIYGRTVFHWLFRYYRPALYTLITLAVIGGLAALYYWRRSTRLKQQNRAGKQPVHKAA